MTTKEYLGQALKLNKLIDSKIRHLDLLRHQAISLTQTITDMPRSASPNLRPMEGLAIKIADLQTEINSDIDKLADMKNDIEKTINNVEDHKLRSVLELRYLYFNTWEHIASELDYHIKHVFKLHLAALAAIQINRHNYIKCDSNAT